LKTRLRLVALLLVVLLPFAAIGTSRALHVVFIPYDLRYVPPESLIICGVGPPESLWAAVDDHFRSAIGRDGPLSEYLGNQQSHIHDKLKVEITKVSQIAALGLDITRGLVVAVAPGPTGQLETLFVLHTSNENVAEESLRAYTNSVPKDYSCTSEGHQQTARKFGDWWLVVPTPGTALIASSCLALLRSTHGTKESLRYFRTLDPLYEVLRHSLRRPLSNGATMFAYVRQPNPAIRDASVSVRFLSDIVKIDAQVKFADNETSILKELLNAPTQSISTAAFLSPAVPLIAQVNDESASQYLNLLQAFDPLVVKERFGDFLAASETTVGLKQNVVAVTGYRDQLPIVVLGFWAPPAQLRSLLDNVRCTLRKRRNQFLITRAREATMANGSISSRGVPTIDLLEQQGLLTKESPNFTEETNLKGSCGSETFQYESYHRKYRGQVIEFVAPKITDNDVRYAGHGEVLAAGSLQGNQYRPAATIVGGVLWVGADERDLETIVDRFIDGRDSRLVTRLLDWFDWASTDVKLRLSTNVERMILTGLISNNDDAQSVAKGLQDLREHPRPFAYCSVDADRSTLHLTIDLPKLRTK
jgi:hypothetical protein